MRQLRLFIALIFFAAAGARSQSLHSDPRQAAQELLAQARSMLGITNIQSISVEAKVHRFIKYVEVSSPTKIKEKEKILTSKLEIDFVMPDKFRAREKGTNIYGSDYNLYVLVNGKDAWLYPFQLAPSTRENRRVVNVGDAEQNVIRQEQEARSMMSRFVLSTLLTSSSVMPFDFSYGGTVSAENGTYDVISMHNRDGFQSFLLLEPNSHLPVMLNEIVIMPQPVTVIPTGFGFDRRFNRAILAKAREERQARAKPPQPISVQIKLLNRQKVGGFNFPYQIKTYYNGQEVEEIEFREFTINHPINPKKFEEKRPQ